MNSEWEAIGGGFEAKYLGFVVKLHEPGTDREDVAIVIYSFVNPWGLQLENIKGSLMKPAPACYNVWKKCNGGKGEG